MALSYRMYEETDEPKLLRLWHEQGGWDEADVDTWRHRFVHTPLGRSYIAIGEDDKTGEIVAQLIFIPSLVRVDDEELPAARPFAPIVSKQARGSLLTVNPLKHPIVQLFRTAAEGMRAAGVSLTYMLPDPSWKLLFKMIPSRRQQMGSFPLFSLPLPLDAPLDLGAGTTAAPLDPADPRIDDLWQRANRDYGCSVVRDTRGLGWKSSHGDFRVTGVESGGRLVGAVTSIHKGDRQWLICDMLAADSGDALRATLAAACNVGHERSLEAPEDDPIGKAALLTPPAMQPVAEELGFARDDWTFPFVLYAIDDDLDRGRVAPERWYLSAND